ncbi:MAG TPA: D-alanyl-D-alanine carboxypeptidase [Candidatus Polarisedimenticolaceae bacterium]|nr:D-alanyl-D-alanine carboxypeptidase [Candidatus Polarisedimenticolaceae bacterium]
MTGRRLALALLIALAFVHPSEAAAPARPAKNTRHATHRAVKPPAMVWHVESIDGTVLDSRDADAPINPASVMKVATSWWALEKLGPDYRFTTSFYARGTLEPEKGQLRGDLVVKSNGDPDFQAENAFLVAQSLNKMGIKRITGSVVVDASFWMGWENGSEGRNPDEDARAETMAARLRSVLDVRRWTRHTRSAWIDYVARTGTPRNPVPSVQVIGGIKYEREPATTTLLFEHRSKALADTLRRFNCFSNNDIERVGMSIGSPSDLAVMLADRLVAANAPVLVDTTSGLGENRLSPRQIVAMLRGFRATASGIGLPVEQLLPVSGCDPGTVTGAFPRLASPPYAKALVAKTGTLTSTDGGITVLAGFLNTAQGEVVFCVAVPHAAGRIHQARRTEESFVLDLIAQHGGAMPRTCGPPLLAPDEQATIITAASASSHGSGNVTSAR